ncbi:hypothetical protein [Dolichospermum flos-aquae]|uniref:Uncharacterized protein n=1 Tax=Dolichospermum flos-aquae CCAP 1403/13F TaxID=315271 RepID=A0A6H2BZE5_DOLFA|nr:hypothetical protein [Dolichospermum flos-aquae]QJB44298.1 hypothetical protein HGD76_08990 [Dolichospermum flos-aquae CCAP 1403/13F]
MKYDDLEELDDSDLPYDITHFSEHDGICTLNGMIPIPVDAVSFSYEGDEDIEIYNERDNFLGVLCICKSNTDINIASLTEARYIAYINEVDKDTFRFPYKFIKNYLVIDVCEYEDYKNNYMDSAPIWGGFFHSNAASNLHQAYRFKPSRLIARPSIVLPTPYHKESCIRSVVQPYAFERFLKLYHLLELIFDWNLVQQIKSLDNDLQGIGQLLNQYSNNKEIDSLKKLLKSKCDDQNKVDKIADCLNKINSPDYLDKGMKIFFDYGKDGNPYNKINNIIPFQDLMNRGGFTRSNSRDSSITGITENNYKGLVIDFSAYCIYRVRCCTAHNRIGEYVMSNDDEGFVVEFAEPLLREVLCQIFSE